MNGSKLANGKMATVTTAMFFEKTKAGDAALQKSAHPPWRVRACWGMSELFCSVGIILFCIY